MRKRTQHLARQLRRKSTGHFRSRSQSTAAKPSSNSLQKLLAARGIGLLRAHTAADGLALAQLHVPDLIVAALSVRGLSTLDFLVAAKADQRLARVPFVVLSGAPAHADHQRRHCMSLGADAFLYRKE